MQIQNEFPIYLDEMDTFYHFIRFFSSILHFSCIGIQYTFYIGSIYRELMQQTRIYKFIPQIIYELRL